jgi:hypothetical protein
VPVPILASFGQARNYRSRREMCKERKRSTQQPQGGARALQFRELRPFAVENANSPSRHHMCAGFSPKPDRNCWSRLILRRNLRREKCVKNRPPTVCIHDAPRCGQFSQVIFEKRFETKTYNPVVSRTWQPTRQNANLPSSYWVCESWRHTTHAADGPDSAGGAEAECCRFSGAEDRGRAESPIYDLRKQQERDLKLPFVSLWEEKGSSAERPRNSSPRSKVVAAGATSPSQKGDWTSAVPQDSRENRMAGKVQSPSTEGVRSSFMG